MTKEVSIRRYLIWGSLFQRVEKPMTISVGGMAAGRHGSGTEAESLHVETTKRWREIGNGLSFRNLKAYHH